MLPYLGDVKGEAKVKKGYDYVFFDATKADGTFGTPDQFKIATDGVIEFNKIYSFIFCQTCDESSKWNGGTSFIV